MRQRRHGPDFVLLVTTLLLVGIGLVMVYSASEYVSRNSTATELDPDGYNYFFVRKQLTWALIGVGALFVGMRINYWQLARLSKLGMLVSILLLILVLIPGVGVERNGAQRWLSFAGQTIQPSEIAKLALSLYLARLISIKGKRMENFKTGLLPVMLVTGVTFGLVVLEPDLGTAIAIGAIAATLVIVGGARWQHIFALGGVAAAAVGGLILVAPYRMARFSFWNPWKDPLKTGFQIIQSWFALGPGGLFGRGLTQSFQKRFYLPEPHTDFILSIIGEELGFFGTATIVALFGLFIWRGFKIAMSAPDDFSTLLAAALTTMIGLQAIINVAVVTGSIPTTGIPLPLISFGGSSLVFTLGSIGILLNISKYARE